MTEECEDQNEVQKNLRESGVYRGMERVIAHDAMKAEAVTVTSECKANINESVYYIGLQDECNSTCYDACSALLQNSGDWVFNDQCKTTCDSPYMENGDILNQLHNITLHRIAKKMEAHWVKSHISQYLMHGRFKSIKVTIGNVEYDKENPFQRNSPFCKKTT